MHRVSVSQITKKPSLLLSSSVFPSSLLRPRAAAFNDLPSNSLLRYVAANDFIMNLKKTGANIPVIIFSVIISSVISHHFYVHYAQTTVTRRIINSIYSQPLLLPSGIHPSPPSTQSNPPEPATATVFYETQDARRPYPLINVSSSSASQNSSYVLETVSILIPDWEVLVIVSTDSSASLSPDDLKDAYACVFENNVISPAKYTGELPFTKRNTFRCELPPVLRRKLPFYQPHLTKSPAESEPPSPSEPPRPEVLLRWNFLVYESFATEDDVVLFVKGVNNRQGINRSPKDLNCVFSDGNKAVRTAVTSSAQEVFRCSSPESAAFLHDPRSEGTINVWLDILEEGNRISVPSVARYTPARTVDFKESKSRICACTMVYNAAKFLKEWVMYNSNLGVGKFILYDNGSDDDLEKVVDELSREGYDVRTFFWTWPKTQEAGFSHCVLYANQICTWMTYVDVDEFIFSPLWLNFEHPSKNMLKSLLPKSERSDDEGHKNRVGQVSISCNEFGPSNQSVHPVNGVTQGYTCRRKMEQRHKSIVLLDAIDRSLANVIHHFHLRDGWRSVQLNLNRAVVNHYKYQAWPEFKAKFRRRVSAYVVDWTSKINPSSRDRTPGLGNEAVEPEGWAQRFCEVQDTRLQELTKRWFGLETRVGYAMAWQG